MVSKPPTPSPKDASPLKWNESLRGLNFTSNEGVGSHRMQRSAQVKVGNTSFLKQWSMPMRGRRERATSERIRKLSYNHGSELYGIIFIFTLLAIEIRWNFFFALAVFGCRSRDFGGSSRKIDAFIKLLKKSDNTYEDKNYDAIISETSAFAWRSCNRKTEVAGLPGRHC